MRHSAARSAPRLTRPPGGHRLLERPARLSSGPSRTRRPIIPNRASIATVQCLGASRTVTGSKFLVETDGRRLLVDCGLYQGLKALRLRNWDKLPVDPARIDAVALTHAHIDHIGYLPRLFKDGFGGPVTATRGTATSRASCCRTRATSRKRRQRTTTGKARTRATRPPCRSTPPRRARRRPKAVKGVDYGKPTRLLPSITGHVPRAPDTSSARRI